jgi:hypothetical protein
LASVPSGVVLVRVRVRDKLAKLQFKKTHKNPGAHAGTSPLPERAPLPPSFEGADNEKNIKVETDSQPFEIALKIEPTASRLSYGQMRIKNRETNRPARSGGARA